MRLDGFDSVWLFNFHRSPCFGKIWQYHAISVFDGSNHRGKLSRDLTGRPIIRVRHGAIKIIKSHPPLWLYGISAEKRGPSLMEWWGIRVPDGTRQSRGIKSMESPRRIPRFHNEAASTKAGRQLRRLLGFSGAR